jgi:hypothetical protein
LEEDISTRWAIEGVWGAYQVVQLNCRDTLVDARDDFLSDSGSVDMLRIKPITEP